MVKQIALHQHSLRRCKKRSSGTVVADDIVAENHGRVKIRILHGIPGPDGGGERLFHRNHHLRGILFHCRLHGGRSAGFQRRTVDETDFFTGKKHLKPHRLPMHVFALQGMAVHYFHHAQAGGMNIDGIIHHPFEQGFLHHDSAPGVGKMGRVRSGGVYAPRAFPDHDSAAFHMKVLRSLDQQGHA